jgi:hypothetical protein
LTLSFFLPSFVPSFLSFSPTLFSDLANLQISRIIFVSDCRRKCLDKSTQHSADTERERERERENLSTTVADPDKANKQTALGNDRRLCIRICYQRTNW